MSNIMKDRGKISIILPCNNAEKFIKYIILDVINQTYCNWELIIISNGDKQDKQINTIRTFLGQDPRISLIENEIAGVSRARNIGIDFAKGNWITFVDADDRIKTEHIQNFMDVIDDESELVVMGYKTILRGKESKFSLSKSDSNKVGINTTVLSLLSSYEGVISTSCNKLFSKKILGERNTPKLRFDDTLSYLEDHVFCLNYLLLCNRIQLIEKNSYIYRVNSQSANSAFHNCMETVFDIIDDKYLHLFEKYSIGNKQRTQSTVTMSYMHKYLLSYNQYKKGCDYSNKEKIANLKRWLFNSEFGHIKTEFSKNHGNWATRLFNIGTKFKSPVFMHLFLQFLTKSRNIVRNIFV